VSEAKRRQKAKRVKGLRLAPDVVVRDHSPMYSSRGTSITGVIIHATVSHNIMRAASDLAAIGSVFHHEEASAHVCTDADSTSARYVNDAQKAWAVCAYNSSTLSIEQISMSTESEKTWLGPWLPEVIETARWVARWSIKYRIPIKRGKIVGGKVIGVMTHKELGAAGGGHVDPGPGYPMGRLLFLAKGIKAALLLSGKHA
jgi:hypothetical protein